MGKIKDLTGIDDDRDAKGATAVPKMSGAAKPGLDTSKSTAGNRSPAPRQAGTTPRPTDKPITGDDRG